MVVQDEYDRTGFRRPKHMKHDWWGQSLINQIVEMEDQIKELQDKNEKLEEILMYHIEKHDV